MAKFIAGILLVGAVQIIGVDTVASGLALLGSTLQSTYKAVDEKTAGVRANARAQARDATRRYQEARK